MDRMAQTSGSNEYEAKTKQLDDLQNNLIHNVNHELRTPLTVILGYADLLRKGQLGLLAPEQQEAILVIIDRAHELQTLMDRINILLAIEAHPHNLMPLSLTDIITQVVEARREKAAQAGLTLELYQIPALPQMVGDSCQLWQAIDCLVENALKFTPTGGRVEVQVKVEADWAFLTVTDTGIGIAEEKLGDIFKDFYQIDGSITRRYGGLGLGLTIARAIVKVHGGQIEVKSRPGQGSQFTLELPIVPTAAKAGQPVRCNAKPQRILVVDDERSVASMLREALEQLPDCEVVVATSGAQALHFFDQQPFDLLITDYNMPDVNGLVLATLVRRSYPQTPIVMLTGYANDTLRKQAAEVSIRRVLDKPVKLKEIRRVASEALSET